MAVREKDAELIEHFRSDLEFCVDLVRTKKFGSKVGEAGARIEHVPQTIGDGRIDYDVGLYSAAAGDEPSLVGVEFALLVGVRGGGGEPEARCVQRLLNGASARRIVKRGGECQARALGQRVD